MFTRLQARACVCASFNWLDRKRRKTSTIENEFQLYLISFRYFRLYSFLNIDNEIFEDANLSIEFIR